jgi:hypothetical protein
MFSKTPPLAAGGRVPQYFVAAFVASRFNDRDDAANKCSSTQRTSQKPGGRRLNRERPDKPSRQTAIDPDIDRGHRRGKHHRDTRTDPNPNRQTSRKRLQGNSPGEVITHLKQLAAVVSAHVRPGVSDPRRDSLGPQLRERCPILHVRLGDDDRDQDVTGVHERVTVYAVHFWCHRNRADR